MIRYQNNSYAVNLPTGNRLKNQEPLNYIELKKNWRADKWENKIGRKKDTLYLITATL